MVVINEMSGLAMRAEIMRHLKWRYEDGALSSPSTGAGDEDPRGDFAGSQWTDSVDASGRDFGDFPLQHATLEAAV